MRLIAGDVASETVPMDGGERIACFPPSSSWTWVASFPREESSVASGGSRASGVSGGGAIPGSE